MMKSRMGKKEEGVLGEKQIIKKEIKKWLIANKER